MIPNMPKVLYISDENKRSAKRVIDAKVHKQRTRGKPWSWKRIENSLIGENLEQALNEVAQTDGDFNIIENIEEVSGHYEYDFIIDGQYVDVKYLISDDWFSISEHCLNHLPDIDYLAFYAPRRKNLDIADFIGVIEPTEEFLDEFKKSHYDGYYMSVKKVKEYLKM